MMTEDTRPEDLTERELFSAFVETLDRADEGLEGYDEARLRDRRTRLLAEIGERLEALEAAKALICETGPGRPPDDPE